VQLHAQEANPIQGAAASAPRLSFLAGRQWFWLFLDTIDDLLSCLLDHLDRILDANLSKVFH
jgi:hypothetical protein